MRSNSLLSGMAFFAAAIFLAPQFAHTQTYEYLLQLASFKKRQNAVQFADRLGAMDETAQIEAAEVPQKGTWYRVQLGPYDSWKDADTKKVDLRKKGISFKNALIRKQAVPSPSTIQKIEVTKPALPASSSESQQAVIQPDQSQASVASTAESDDTPRKLETASAADSDAGMSTTIAAKTSTSDTPKKPLPVQNSPAASHSYARGSGRNMAKNNIALSLRHMSVKFDTELTGRDMVYSDSTREATADDVDAFRFDTSMQIDTLRVRYGLTDYLEIFGDIGAAYDLDDPDPQLVYGGGARLNLFSKVLGLGQQLYGAVQGDYLGGELETDYDSSAGNNWKKEADWAAISARLELGIIMGPSLLYYLGGLYVDYDEETDRRPTEDLAQLPDNFAYYADDLEGEENYGFYGGLEYRFAPHWMLTIETQYINQTSVVGGVQYQF